MGKGKWGEKEIEKVLETIVLSEPNCRHDLSSILPGVKYQEVGSLAAI